MNEPDVIVLVKEREKRSPKEGDVYVMEPFDPSDAGLTECKMEFADTPGNHRTCYTRHDLTPPEGAVSADFVWINSSGGWFSRSHIPLPPKEEKKWPYHFVIKGVTITTEPITSKQAQALSAELGVVIYFGPEEVLA